MLAERVGSLPQLINQLKRPSDFCFFQIKCYPKKDLVKMPTSVRLHFVPTIKAKLSRAEQKLVIS